MYNAQLTIKRIQSLIKEKGYTQKFVLAECGINENTLKRMTDNKGISSFYLAKIADYLQCSVDYLLNKTNTSMHYQSNNNGNIVNGNNGNNSPLTVNPDNSSNQDTIKQNFITLFDNLSPENQIEVMYFAKQLMKKEN